MPRDEIRRQALARDLARRQAPLSLDALRVLDRFTLALQLVEQQHGKVDLKALRRLVPRFDPRAPVGTAIGAALCAVGIELALVDEDRAELDELARRELDQAGNREAIADYRERESARFGATPVVTVGGGLGNPPVTLGARELPLEVGSTVAREIVELDTGPIAAAAEFVEEQHATRIGGPNPYESLEIDGREAGR